MEDLYSVSEAADKLRLSKWTVHAMLGDGRLRRTKIGSRVLIRESELARLVAEGDGKKGRGRGRVRAANLQ